MKIYCSLKLIKHTTKPRIQYMPSLNSAAARLMILSLVGELPAPSVSPKRVNF